MGKQIFLFNIYKGCIWNKMCSLVCLKANTVVKTKERYKKRFYCDQVQNEFAHFGGLIKNLKLN